MFHWTLHEFVPNTVVCAPCSTVVWPQWASWQTCPSRVLSQTRSNSQTQQDRWAKSGSMFQVYPELPGVEQAATQQEDMHPHPPRGLG